MTTNTALAPNHHRRLTILGAVLSVLGLLLLLLAFAIGPAGAKPSFSFQGDCVGSPTAGTCVLDEPEGQNPAVHGLVTYVRVGQVLSFVIETPARIDELQVCMQTTGPFPQGANVCAGRHGPHVTFTQAGSTYAVDLAANGLATADPLYWTLHVVSGGRTLQVNGRCGLIPTTTTTTKPPTTTTKPPTTTTTTTPNSTTTVPSSSTTALQTTSTTPGASTTFPTSTTAVISGTTTTQPVRVLGNGLARTGDPQWWLLVVGAALLLVGLTIMSSVRLLRPRA